MNTSQLLREIKRTDKTLREARRVIADYQMPEPYCYLMPALGFFIGYQAQSKISTSSMLQLIKTQLMLNTLLETQKSTTI